MDYNDGDLVLCRVIEVSKTAVSVVLENDSGVDGTIPISEIAPGRIRNLRDYVVPNKRIVCKILRVNPAGSLVLSLRRVSIKEMKEVLEGHKKDKAAIKLLEVIVGDVNEANNIRLRMLADGKRLRDVIDNSKVDSSDIVKYLPKTASDKLLKVILEKKDKDKEVKRIVLLKSRKPLGLLDIKKILSNCKCSVSYIAGGKYSLSLTATDYKDANNRLSGEVLSIEKQAKECGAEFAALEK
jgi:translation initiation factor 2 alpha subunit (eIF-2alpha)